MADLTIALVYPALLGTYGDGGNASVLAARLRWRGISTDVVCVDVGDAVPRSAQLFVLGGGEDAAQSLAVQRLASDGTLSARAAEGAAVFAVCAGFQILGRSFLEGTGHRRQGLGLLDCVTDRLPGTRAVGEVVARPADPRIGTLTGYENHGGRTRLGPLASPLATVTTGIGNGEGSRTEGARQGSIIATYLHGPALARNPGLADAVLRLATGGVLDDLDDTEEEELRRERLQFVRRSRRAPWHRQWRPAARS
ncbi:MAG TPA: glutamine amidotransferase [Mycobacteriales bacterium]|nr:glutamine amidotransferase [Mycobacteriales bacterium]